MKKNYSQPFAEPVEMIPGFMLLSSFNATGSDYEEPIEMTDDEFNSIFG